MSRHSIKCNRCNEEISTYYLGDDEISTMPQALARGVILSTIGHLIAKHGFTDKEIYFDIE